MHENGFLSFQDLRKVGYINHPATLMYKDHQGYLTYYLNTLESFRNGWIKGAEEYNLEAMKRVPSFVTPEFITQMKRRLYTKDKEYYNQFSELGESNQNWYFVDGVMRVYENGKRIK